MGKKLLWASALAAGGLLAVSNTMVNVALRRKTAPQAPKLSAAEREEAWLSGAKYITHRNREDMRLRAWFIPQDSRRYAVICHGYGGNSKQMLARAKHFYDMGFNVLLPDSRAHGGSDGRMIGMGWPERRDIVEWVYELLRRDEDAQIVLFGISMGAATVMMTAGEVLPKQVKLVIEDCGYTSAWEQFKAVMPPLYHTPPYPVLPVASVLARLRTGYSFRRASALAQMRQCRIPVLFIHGEKDELVPSSMALRLYGAARCEKQLLIVPEAGHAEAAEKAPELYWDTIRTFIEKYIGR